MTHPAHDIDAVRKHKTHKARQLEKRLLQVLTRSELRDLRALQTRKKHKPKPAPQFRWNPELSVQQADFGPGDR